MFRKELPIWRDANRLLVAVEQSVRHFPRYHKYTLGSEMRRQAMNICRLIQRAWFEQRQRKNHATSVELQANLDRLIYAVDDLKLQLQLAKELQVFRDFTEFQRLAELTVSVGKQSGGWRKRATGRRPEVAQNNGR